MLERIVVPLDGSLTGEAILPYVRQILRRADAEVLLIRAVIPAPSETSLLVTDASVAAARAYVAGVQVRLEKEGVRVGFDVRVGSPVGVILDVAEEAKATMIAMATHGATGLKRILLGSVAEGVMRKTRVPVLAVRPFWEGEDSGAEVREAGPIRNLLLPVDASDLATMAVPAATDVARLFEARVLLLRVMEAQKKPEDLRKLEDAEMQLRAMASSFDRQGVETETLIQRGEPVDEILKTVRFHHVDLLVMATHGRSGIRRLVEGSVTEQLLRRTPVPLLIVRAGKAAAIRRRTAVARRK